MQISRGKFNRLLRTTAGFTLRALDGYGLCGTEAARPALTPHIRFLFIGSRICSTLTFRRHLTMTPLRFANPSPPSGWVEDFHLQAVEHARHTRVGAILVIALGDGQIRPYRNAPVPWQEPKVPAKAGKDRSFMDPVSVSLNGSVLDRSFTPLCSVQDDMKRCFPRFLTHNKRLKKGRRRWTPGR